MNIDMVISSAKNGDVESQERLAWEYHTGENVRKNEKKSFFWAAQAALSGRSPVSCYHVSIAYFNGEGVAEDDVKAFLWAKRSAGQGAAEGYFAVGVHYLYGYGVLPNVRAAISYLTQAYQMNHNPAAADLLANIYFNGNQVRKSYKKAFEWLCRAAIHGGDSAVFYDISLYYWQALGIKKDDRKAFLWVKKSAKYGDIDGMLAAGWHYLNGLGVKKNIELAEYWFQKVIEKSPKCSKAFYNLGYIYFHQYRDDQAAFQFFMQAYAIDRHLASAYMLARMLAAGHGGVCDCKKAKRLLKEAAAGGHRPAQRLLRSKRWAALCHLVPSA